jgi:multicomponent Na+:H+ antiporter subunit F
MSPPATGPVVAVAVNIAFGVITLSLFLAFVRLVRGPSLPDRVVALDLLATLAVGIIAAYAILTGQPMLLRPAVALSLLAFLGTVAFAYYIEKRGRS